MKTATPNLPQNKVTLFACADRQELVDSLKALNAEVIAVKESEIFNNVENDHPDMHLCHLGGNKVVVYKEDEYLWKELSKRDFEVIFAQTEKTGKYPNCAALNVCIIGKIVLCNIKAADKTILDYAQQNGYKIIDCKQGYSRCSTLVVSENSAITDDISVYNALKNEIDVLLVSKGGVDLDGKIDGFIGGCSCFTYKNHLAFFGNLECHPDKEKIEKFLNKYDVKPLCLNSGKLCDVGTILPLCEG